MPPHLQITYKCVPQNLFYQINQKAHLLTCLTFESTFLLCYKFIWDYLFPYLVLNNFTLFEAFLSYACIFLQKGASFIFFKFQKLIILGYAMEMQNKCMLFHFRILYGRYKNTQGWPSHEATSPILYFLVPMAVKWLFLDPVCTGKPLEVSLGWAFAPLFQVDCSWEQWVS